MDKKIISVIITNYNYARYLPQCINSVIQSDFDLNNLEIILIDDASTDDSVKVTEQIIGNSKVSIRLLINDTNIQLIRSRNRGIANASGEFIFILDADNYIGPDCLKKHYETMAGDRELVACYAPVREFSDTTNELLGLRSNRVFSYQELLHGNYIDAMAMFNRRQLIETGMYNPYLPPDLWEDYELWLRLGKAGRNVAFIAGEPLTYYRVHPQSKLSTASDVNLYHVVKYIRSYHRLNYSYSFNDNNELIRNNEEIFSQLFFSESENVIEKIEKGNQEIRFSYSRPLRSSRLHFIPVNDFVEVRIHSVTIKLENNIHDVSFRFSSNAIAEDSGYYLFDTPNPVICIDFQEEIELDEVLVQANIMKIGDNTYSSILKKKDEQCRAYELMIQQMELKAEELDIDLKHLTARLINIEHQYSLLRSTSTGLKSYRIFKIIQKVMNTGLGNLWSNIKAMDSGKQQFEEYRKMVSKSNYFDSHYYLSKNPDVKASGINPALHYLICGGFEAKNPSEKFNSAYYLQQNPDVKMSGMNPLVHYLLFGQMEGRKPVLQGLGQIHENKNGYKK